ncbi:MAG: hypothetical protein AAFR37_06405 [Cyanobacteria bacterium J06628_3]
MQFLLIARIPKDVTAEQAIPHVQAEAQKVWENYSFIRTKLISCTIRNKPKETEFLTLVQDVTLKQFK